MRYFVLSPEVAGGLGRNAVLSPREYPPSAARLHYELDGWLGDDLLESYPCFVVTERLALALAAAGLSGAELHEVEVTTSEHFRGARSNRSVPEFAWLHVIGTAGQDDFGIDRRGSLVVSEKALGILKTVTLEHCNVAEP